MIGTYKIYAKSVLKRDELLAKHILEHDGIEIQLFGDVTSGNWDKEELVKAFKDDEIKSVHTPLGKDYFGLEQITDLVIFQRLWDICDFANELGALNDIKILIVIHLELTLAEIQNYGIYDSICAALESLLEAFPNIEFGIENVTPFVSDGITATNIKLRNSFYLDAPALVRTLRTDIQTDRIGTVLDTCHAEISLKIIELFNKLFDIPTSFDMDLEAYFAANADVCKEIHIATFKEYGSTKETHGIPFTKLRQVEHLLKLYDEYHYNCPICIEVKEQNYLNCVGYKASREVIQEYVQSKEKGEN